MRNVYIDPGAAKTRSFISAPGSGYRNHIFVKTASKVQNSTESSCSSGSSDWGRKRKADFQPRRSAKVQRQAQKLAHNLLT